MRLTQLVPAVILLFFSLPVQAGIITYGDMDCLNWGCYGSDDPTAGATPIGLLPGVVTPATWSYGHLWPISPETGDYPGTDQIYVGSGQTIDCWDGYCNAGPLNGPQVFLLDYSSLIPAGQTVVSFTLGIAADDFQFPVWAQPFSASINGSVHPALTSTLNSLDQSGARVQFFTIGIDPALLNGTNVLDLRIDEGGDGGDGWAVDFLTVGVETSGVPEPGCAGLLGTGLAALFWLSRRRVTR
jgi:hypothetical protein